VLVNEEPNAARSCRQAPERSRVARGFGGRRLWAQRADSRRLRLRRSSWRRGASRRRRTGRSWPW